MAEYKRIASLIFLTILFWSCCAYAEEKMTALVPTGRQTAEITGTIIDGENWFFLPSHARLETISFRNADGQEEYPAMISEDGHVHVQSGENTVHVMKSENIRSLFLYSDDPIHQGRTYIDGGENHSTYTSASMALVGADGRVDHSGRIRTLRGRGNGTWRGPEKKAYQFKLEEKTDLLDTGKYEEQNRTWILLALAMDSTYLHDRIAFDLARELGDETASASEHVNLYYDGEYRGLYLLREKTEINSGRINELDYQKLIEEWGKRNGLNDLEQLPQARALNRFGNEFSYMDHVPETTHPNEGAFLLEMENEWLTLSDPCWFRLSDGSMIACKNPETASLSMMTYISEQLEEARQTLLHRGLNPETGRTIEEYFDVSAFARSILISELSGNVDSYVWSSTYFVLPAGKIRFMPGPPWDYDLAWHYYSDKEETLDAKGFRHKTGWIPAFMSCHSFLKEVKRLCQGELAVCIEEILLGDKQGVYLQPIDRYAAQIDAARRMNEMLWPIAYEVSDLIQSIGFETDLELMKQYIKERSTWLFETVEAWDLTSAEQVEIWADCLYLNIENNLRIQTYPWVNAEVISSCCEQLTEATEEQFARWYAEVEIAPLEGFSFQNPSVTINGTSIEAVLQENGNLLIAFEFEDPSYRPVDAYGEDIGLVYDYDIYVSRYPEVAEECGYDPDAVLDYFLEEGMYEGHRANGFFSPTQVLLRNPELEEFLGEDWWLYYQEFIAYGWEEWTLPEARFDLNIHPLS